MGTHFCQYNESLYCAIKMAENIVDQEQIDESAMESSMEKQLNDSAASYLEQSDSIVREMTELKDELQKEQAEWEQEDPFFIPFLIAGAVKAAAVAAKAALAAKAVIAAKAAIAAKLALAAKAAKATALGIKMAKAAKAAAALAKAAKVAKAAKMAKMAAKAGKGETGRGDWRERAVTSGEPLAGDGNSLER